MKFKELVYKYNWDDVRSTFMRLYPDQEKNVEGYKQVFEELPTLKPVETKIRIVIEDIFDEYDGKYYTHVSGKNGTLNKESDPEHFKDDEVGNQEVSYAIEYTSWEEWLEMEIDPSSLKRYSNLENIAHCLWEMTFAGFDQTKIKEQINELNRRVKEIDNMTEEERKERLIPMKDIKKKFKEKYGTS